MTHMRCITTACCTSSPTTSQPPRTAQFVLVQEVLGRAVRRIAPNPRYGARTMDQSFEVLLEKAERLDAVRAKSVWWFRRQDLE